MAADRRPARPGEIPWFWCWEDREAAALCASAGTPFVAGPNILFATAAHPCRIEAEREICNAASCRLLFTESAWYGELIERHRGPANRAPIVLWPYPIDPRPGGPLPPQYDLLVYEKSGIDAAAGRRACSGPGRGTSGSATAAIAASSSWRWPARSRCCLYLSDDDRGPLALAEILLAGCPAVGDSERGAVHRARPHGRPAGEVGSAILSGGGGPLPAA